ncbi:MAG TPA: hypothetical protein PKZ65_11885, partial [Methanoregulaceae archaeon]|nr:hypothetical protein [Methanoregulaceae archaeon]
EEGRDSGDDPEEWRVMVSERAIEVIRTCSSSNIGILTVCLKYRTISGDSRHFRSEHAFFSVQ